MSFSYYKLGSGPVLLLLHGWGLDKEKYKKLGELLSKKYLVVAVDLPGFGGAEKPSRSWSVSDYAEWVVEFLKKEKICPKIILGHSLGGRVAVKLVANKMVEIEKLVLVASAGIERKSLKVKLLGWVAKLVPEAIKIRINFGSSDYRKTKGVMKETFKKVVGENLEGILKKVDIPTLLVWGRNDQTTPIWQARLFEKEIAGSKLVVTEGNHGIPYRESEAVAKIVVDFLK